MASLPLPSGLIAVPSGLLAALSAPAALIAGRPPAATSGRAPIPAPPAIADAVPAADDSSAIDARAETGPALPAPRTGRLRVHRASGTNDESAPPTSILIYPELLPLPDYLRRAPELREFRPWPFAPTAINLDNSAVVMVLVSAIAVMTALTVAGASVGGRPMRHMAWRSTRYRYRFGSDWNGVPAEPGETAATAAIEHKPVFDSLATLRQAKAAVRLPRVA